MEFICYKTKQEIEFKRILQNAHDHKILEVDFLKNEVTFTMTQRNKDIYVFLREMLQSFVDTYYFAICAVKYLKVNKKTVEMRSLFQNLSLQIN